MMMMIMPVSHVQQQLMMTMMMTLTHSGNTYVNE